MKIALVDDNPDMNRLFNAAGTIEGVDTVFFSSSPEALSWLSENEADVAILDLELPIIDGLRLAKEIRKNEEIHPDKRPVKLVFYTGQDIDDTIERVGQKVGVPRRHMIRKPYPLADLVHELKKEFGEV